MTAREMPPGWRYDNERDEAQRSDGTRVVEGAGFFLVTLPNGACSKLEGLGYLKDALAHIDGTIPLQSDANPLPAAGTPKPRERAAQLLLHIKEVPRIPAGPPAADTITKTKGRLLLNGMPVPFERLTIVATEDGAKATLELTDIELELGMDVPVPAPKGGP